MPGPTRRRLGVAGARTLENGRALITRITRGRLAPNTEARVFSILRTAAAAQPIPPGMASMSLSRTMEDRDTVLVAVSVWSDMAAMTAALSADWQEPSWPTGIGECIESATVEILETVATAIDVEHLAATG